MIMKTNEKTNSDNHNYGGKTMYKKHTMQRITAVLLLLMIFLAAGKNVTQASLLQEPSEWEEEDPEHIAERAGYERWEENKRAYVLYNSYYEGYSPYPGQTVADAIGLCITEEDEMIPFKPWMFFDFCRYGLDGNVLFYEDEISEDENKQILLMRIADGEEQVILQADRNAVRSMLFLGNSADGRYHYIRTFEKDAEGEPDNVFYLYDDLTAQLQKIDMIAGTPNQLCGAAVSPDGYYFVVGDITEESTGRLRVYSLDGKNDAVYDDFELPTSFLNMYCDNNGNILFRADLYARAGVIRHSEGTLTLLDIDYGNCTANTDCSQFLLSNADSVWFYSFDMEAPVFVCEGKSAYLMAPDAMKYDSSQTMLCQLALSRNNRYYVDSFNGMCFFTEDGKIYRIDDFETGSVQYLADCAQMETNGFCWTNGKARRGEGFACSYCISDDLSQIVFLSETGLYYMDVQNAQLSTLRELDGTKAVLYVNQEFTKAIVASREYGFVLIDLVSGEIRENGVEMNNWKKVYSVRTDCFDGVAFAENGQLMLMDYDGNTRSVDTSVVKYETSDSQNFAEESYALSEEVNGSRIWCTLEDETTLCVYRLNDDLKFEQLTVRRTVY